MAKEANPITLIFEEFIHDFCQRLLFADLHIRNDHTDYLNFKVSMFAFLGLKIELHFSTPLKYRSRGACMY